MLGCSRWNELEAAINGDTSNDDQTVIESRYKRLADLKAGEYALGGGVIDPLPDDAPPRPSPKAIWNNLAGCWHEPTA